MKAPKYPKRGNARKPTRKASNTQTPASVTACAKKVANYRYTKDLDYQKYLKDKNKKEKEKKRADASKTKAEASLKKKQATSTALKALPKVPKSKNKTKPKSKKEFLDAARKRDACIF